MHRARDAGASPLTFTRMSSHLRWDMTFQSDIASKCILMLATMCWMLHRKPPRGKTRYSEARGHSRVRLGNPTGGPRRRR